MAHLGLTGCSTIAIVLLLLLFAMIYFMSTSMKLGYTIAIPSGPKVLCQSVDRSRLELHLDMPSELKNAAVRVVADPGSGKAHHHRSPQRFRRLLPTSAWECGPKMLECA